METIEEIGTLLFFSITLSLGIVGSFWLTFVGIMG